MKKTEKIFGDAAGELQLSGLSKNLFAGLTEIYHGKVERNYFA